MGDCLGGADRVVTGGSSLSNQTVAAAACYAKTGIIKKKANPTSVGWVPRMELNGTSAETQAQIIALMETELAGGNATAFAPYRENGEIFFRQRWLFLPGIKR